MCISIQFGLAAAAVPMVSEVRTLSHPAPAADTFFGPVVDISNK
jgi:hypothetical protein